MWCMVMDLLWDSWGLETSTDMGTQFEVQVELIKKTKVKIWRNCQK